MPQSLNDWRTMNARQTAFADANRAKRDRQVAAILAILERRDVPNDIVLELELREALS